MREMSSWVIAVCIICRGCINLYSVNFVIPLSTDPLVKESAATFQPIFFHVFVALKNDCDQMLISAGSELTVVRERCYFVLKLKWRFQRLRTLFHRCCSIFFYLYFDLHVEPNKVFAPLKWRFNSEHTASDLVAPCHFRLWCPTMSPITVR